MKKLLSLFIILSLAASILMLTACKSDEAEDISKDDVGGKIYVYELGGFGGDFIITLFDDGTFSYSEGPLSSHIGLGGWMLEDNTVTITEHSGRTNVFTVREGELVFRESGSDNFKYVKLENGTHFSVMSEIGEKN